VVISGERLLSKQEAQQSVSMVFEAMEREE